MQSVLGESSFLSRSFYFWPGVTAPVKMSLLPWENGSFDLSKLSYSDVGVATSLAFSQLGQSSVQDLC